MSPLNAVASINMLFASSSSSFSKEQLLLLLMLLLLLLMLMLLFGVGGSVIRCGHRGQCRGCSCCCCCCCYRCDLSYQNKAIDEQRELTWQIRVMDGKWRVEAITFLLVDIGEVLASKKGALYVSDGKLIMCPALLSDTLIDGAFLIFGGC